MMTTPLLKGRAQYDLCSSLLYALPTSEDRETAIDLLKLLLMVADRTTSLPKTHIVRDSYRRHFIQEQLPLISGKINVF